MKRTYRNDDYVETHNKNPRGYGRWAFSVTVYAGERGHTDLGTKFACNNFATARKQVSDDAVSEARTIGGATEVIIETLG